MTDICIETILSVCRTIHLLELECRIFTVLMNGLKKILMQFLNQFWKILMQFSINVWARINGNICIPFIFPGRLTRESFCEFLIFLMEFLNVWLAVRVWHQLIFVLLLEQF